MRVVGITGSIEGQMMKSVKWWNQWQWLFPGTFFSFVFREFFHALIFFDISTLMYCIYYWLIQIEWIYLKLTNSIENVHHIIINRTCTIFTWHLNWFEILGQKFFFFHQSSSNELSIQKCSYLLKYSSLQYL